MEPNALFYKSKYMKYKTKYLEMCKMCADSSMTNTIIELGYYVSIDGKIQKLRDDQAEAFENALEKILARSREEHQALEEPMGTMNYNNWIIYKGINRSYIPFNVAIHAADKTSGNYKNLWIQLGDKKFHKVLKITNVYPDLVTSYFEGVNKERYQVDETSL